MGELLASFSKVSNPFAAGSCSALIKVNFFFCKLINKDTHKIRSYVSLANEIKLLSDDLYVSHVTWGPYEVMLKMAKHYRLNFHLNQHGLLVLF
jgi:hypothetical protein